VNLETNQKTNENPENDGLEKYGRWKPVFAIEFFYGFSPHSCAELLRLFHPFMKGIYLFTPPLVLVGCHVRRSILS
jgi:hypothetical protein